MTTQQKKIIDQLMRLEVLFDKVAILCRAIGRYGLFNGQVDYYDGEFKFFPFRENESCIDFVYDPEAYALELSCATYPDGNWYCLLVSEDDQNSVMLGFSTETGDLMEVDPDASGILKMLIREKLKFVVLQEAMIRLMFIFDSFGME